MKKIVFFGDSITDSGRNKEADLLNSSYGHGYVLFASGKIMTDSPNKYEVYNRGISGNRIVDAYARIKKDVWNLEPDVLSIYIGVNDVWHEIKYNNGVELDRFSKMYRTLLEDTIKRLPNCKLIMIEPFVVKGTRTNDGEGEFEKFMQVYEYAKVCESLAKEFNIPYLKTQDMANETTEAYGEKFFAIDGVHPSITGSKLIADEWVKLFYEKIDK